MTSVSCVMPKKFKNVNIFSIADEEIEQRTLAEKDLIDTFCQQSLLAVTPYPLSESKSTHGL